MLWQLVVTGLSFGFIMIPYDRLADSCFWLCAICKFFLFLIFYITNIIGLSWVGNRKVKLEFGTLCISTFEWDICNHVHGLNFANGLWPNYISYFRKRGTACKRVLGDETTYIDSFSIGFGPLLYFLGGSIFENSLCEILEFAYLFLKLWRTLTCGIGSSEVGDGSACMEAIWRKGSHTSCSSSLVF